MFAGPVGVCWWCWVGAIASFLKESSMRREYQCRMSTCAFSALSLTLLGGCDDVTNQVFDTVLFALDIVSVWL